MPETEKTIIVGIPPKLIVDQRERTGPGWGESRRTIEGSGKDLWAFAFEIVNAVLKGSA